MKMREKKVQEELMKVSLGSHITREAMEAVLENRGISVSPELYDKLWTYLDTLNDGSIHIPGFLRYMQNAMD
jgi:Ca2+-binding EF-hand superfamily protein